MKRTLDMLGYLPVKVLKSEYAEKMLHGEIRMAPLSEFGGWNIQNYDDDQAARKDVKEGVLYNVSPEEYDSFFSTLPPEMKAVIRNRWYLNDTEKYTHLFCMYRLPYSYETHTFERMNERMAELGDSAVIILRPDLFCARVFNWVVNKYINKYAPSVRDIMYRSFSKDYGEWGVFVKDKPYSWQNEVRIAARLNPRLKKVWEQKEDLGEWHPELGDLSDIVRIVPTQELIDNPLSIKKLGNETQEYLESKQLPQIGFIKEEIVLYGDFGIVYPEKGDISVLQRVFPCDEWYPITEMACLVPGGDAIPALSFRRITEEDQIVRFLPDRVIISQTDDTVDTVVKILNTFFPDGRNRISDVQIRQWYNMGEISEQMDIYNAKHVLNDKNTIYDHHSYHEITELMISLDCYKTIWGIDHGYKHWSYSHMLATSIDSADTNSICRIIRQMRTIITDKVKKDGWRGYL